MRDPYVESRAKQERKAVIKVVLAAAVTITVLR